MDKHRRTAQTLLLSALVLAAAGTAAAYEKVYSLGDKIDGSSLIVQGQVAEARELAAKPKKPGAEPELVSDYLYRIKVKSVLKGRQPGREATVIQSPEYRAEPRYYTPGKQVIAFLQPNLISGRYLAMYRLPRQPYYQTFGYKQGALVVSDSSAASLAKAIQLYQEAKRAKPALRPAKWAALLALGHKDLEESALQALQDYRYYPALDLYIRLLADENQTALATKILVTLAPDSLRPKLPLLLLLDKSSSRRIRSNMLKVVASIDDERVYKLLLKSLKDENYEMRAVAATGLERWNDPKAVKSLKKALKDGDGFVRDAAYQALAKQGFQIEKKKDGYYKITKEPKQGGM